MALAGFRSGRHAETLTRMGRFGMVGGLGFIVDAGLTLTLIGLNLSPFTSRLIAMALAILVTWRLNRAITFGASVTSATAEGLRYGTVALTAAISNYVLYAILILSVSAIMPVLAIALATGLSMIVSYLGYTYFAFRSAKPTV